MPGRPSSDPDVQVSVIANERTWIASEAVDQLRRAAGLPGMIRAVGMPDLHPGAGAPIGAALLADRVWPHLVGGDIGCGVALWVLRPKRRLDAQRAARCLTGLDRVKDGELDQDWASGFDAPPRAALGTIGAGNHFLEIGTVDEVFDTDAAGDVGLEAGSLVMLVHSGSRGLGQEILDRHTQDHGAQPCPEDLVATYMADHDGAMRFAVANRAAVAARAADRLGVDLDVHRPLIDLCHNSVVAVADGWLHRKGAAPNHGGLIALPGSRGARSHVVVGSSDETARARALWSVAHGAGRKYSRSAARDRFGDVPRRELRTTRWGSTVICTDPVLLAEEAPGAYKSIEDVVDSLSAAGLVTPVVATIPVATYKTERGGAGPENRERRQRDRTVARNRAVAAKPERRPSDRRGRR